jgi:hypothetical protein
VNRLKASNIHQQASLAIAIAALISLQPIFTSVSKSFAEDPNTIFYSNPITLAYPFKLSANQTAYLEPADLVFRFVNVTEDSRCPSDVQCIWAGQVSILIEYWRVSSLEKLGTFTLTLMGSSSSDSSARTIEGYLVKLERVDPYPVSTRQIQPSEYVATLIVLKADSTTESLLASSPVALNDEGEKVESIRVGEKVKVSMALHNGFDDDRKFVAIIEARNLDDRGVTEFLASPDGTVSANGWVDVGLSWTPENAGNYQLRTFVIDSFVAPRILTPVTTSEIVVQAESTNGESITLIEGQRDGPLLVQKIYADHVEGLNFLEYPVAMEAGLPISLRIGEKASNGCTIGLTLTGIQEGSATFLKVVDESKPCPICWYQSELMFGP